MRLFIQSVFLILISVSYYSCQQKSKYVIGVSQCSVDEWRDKMNMEMLNEAALSQNIELITLRIRLFKKIGSLISL